MAKKVYDDILYDFNDTDIKDKLTLRGGNPFDAYVTIDDKKVGLTPQYIPGYDYIAYNDGNNHMWKVPIDKLYPQNDDELTPQQRLERDWRKSPAYGFDKAMLAYLGAGISPFAIPKLFGSLATMANLASDATMATQAGQAVGNVVSTYAPTILTGMGAVTGIHNYFSPNGYAKTLQEWENLKNDPSFYTAVNFGKSALGDALDLSMVYPAVSVTANGLKDVGKSAYSSARSTADKYLFLQRPKQDLTRGVRKFFTGKTPQLTFTEQIAKQNGEAMRGAQEAVAVEDPFNIIRIPEEMPQMSRFHGESSIPHTSNDHPNAGYYWQQRSPRYNPETDQMETLTSLDNVPNLRQTIDSIIERVPNAQIRPEFLDSNYINGFRQNASRQGIDVSSLSNEDIAKILTEQYNQLSSTSSGLVKDNVFWRNWGRTLPPREFDWQSHTGESTGNTGLWGEGNYFGTGRYSTSTGSPNEPYMIKGIEEIGYDDALMMNDATGNRTATDWMAASPNTRMIVGTDSGRNNYGWVDDSTLGTEAVTQKNTGIKSLYPDLTIGDGTTFPRDWSNPDVRRMQSDDDFLNSLFNDMYGDDYTQWPIYQGLKGSGRFTPYDELEDFVIGPYFGDVIGEMGPSNFYRNFMYPYMENNLTERIPGVEKLSVFDSDGNIRDGIPYLKELANKNAKIFTDPFDSAGGVAGFYRDKTGEAYIKLNPKSSPEDLSDTYVHERGSHGTDEVVDALSGETASREYGTIGKALEESGIERKAKDSINWEEVRATMKQTINTMMRAIHRSSSPLFKGKTLSREDIERFRNIINGLSIEKMQGLLASASSYGVDYANLLKVKPELLDTFKFLLSKGLSIGAPIGIGAGAAGALYEISQDNERSYGGPLVQQANIFWPGGSKQEDEDFQNAVMGIMNNDMSANRVSHITDAETGEQGKILDINPGGTYNVQYSNGVFPMSLSLPEVEVLGRNLSMRRNRHLDDPLVGGELKNNQYNTLQPQWIVDQNVDAWTERTTPTIGSFISAGLKPFDLITPSRYVGLFDSDNKDGFLHLFNDNNRGFFIGNDPTKPFSKQFHDEHPYIAGLTNMVGDAMGGYGVGKVLNTTNELMQPIKGTASAFLDDAKATVGSYIKHPSYRTVYHGSPTAFDVRKAKTSSLNNLGFHVGDKETATYMATKRLGNKGSDPMVQKMRIPKEDTTTIDTWDNGVEQLYEDYSVAPNAEINPTDYRMKELFSEQGKPLSIKENPDVAGEFVYAGEPASLNVRSSYPRIAENPKYNSIADDIVDEFKKVNQSYFFRSQNDPSSFDFIRLNQRANDLLKDAGYRVVKYANRNADEGGTLGKYVNSYFITDPSVIEVLPDMSLSKYRGIWNSTLNNYGNSYYPSVTMPLFTANSAINNIHTLGGSLVQQANKFRGGGPKRNKKQIEPYYGIYGNVSPYIGEGSPILQYDAEKDEWLSDTWSDDLDRVKEEKKWYKNAPESFRNNYRMIVDPNGDKVKYVTPEQQYLGSWRNKDTGYWGGATFGTNENGDIVAANPFDGEIITGDGRLAVPVEGMVDDYGNQIYEAGNDYYIEGKSPNEFAEGGPLNTPKQWKDLSVEEKSDIMKVAIRNGITNLPDIRNKYNEFAVGGNIYDGVHTATQKLNSEVTRQSSVLYDEFPMVMAMDGVYIKFSSTYRPGAVTSKGKRSRHSIYGDAGDIIPINGSTFEDIARVLNDPNSNTSRWMLKNKFGYLNETTPDVMAQTGATGKHFHIGRDTGLVNRYVSMMSGNNQPSLKERTIVPAWERRAESYWAKAEPMYKELLNAGIDPVAAAGILGNIAQESGFNPRAMNNVSGGHWGYLQNDKNITPWVRNNYGGYDHQHQMNYLIAGLQGKLPTNNMGLDRRFNGFNTRMQGVTDPEMAAYLWEREYERSANENIPERKYFARYFYDKMMGNNPNYSQSNLQQSQQVAHNPYEGWQPSNPKAFFASPEDYLEDYKKLYGLQENSQPIVDTANRWALEAERRRAERQQKMNLFTTVLNMTDPYKEERVNSSFNMLPAFSNFNIGAYGGHKYDREAEPTNQMKRGRYWTDDNSILPELLVTPQGNDYVKDEAGNPAKTVGAIRDINPHANVYERVNRELRNNQYRTMPTNSEANNYADWYTDLTAPGAADLLVAATKPLELLSPSHLYRAAKDYDSDKGFFNNLWESNSGFVSPEFQQRHPWISTGINLLGDAAIYGAVPKVLNTAGSLARNKGFAFNNSNNTIFWVPLNRSWNNGLSYIKFDPNYPEAVDYIKSYYPGEGRKLYDAAIKSRGHIISGEEYVSAPKTLRTMERYYPDREVVGNYGKWSNENMLTGYSDKTVHAYSVEDYLNKADEAAAAGNNTDVVFTNAPVYRINRPYDNVVLWSNGGNLYKDRSKVKRK